MNDLTLLMDLKFSTDIPEDIMKLASEWSSASDPNDVVYIILEEEPVGSNHHSSVQEPQHHIPVKYRCDQCFAEFDDMAQLEYHVSCQHYVTDCNLEEENILNDQLLSLTNCETFQNILESFHKEQTVNSQIEPPPEKLYDCKHCGKSFSKRFLLREHLKDAVKQNPFICEQCGLCFQNRENLKNHLPVHSEETFYTCKDCGKTFRQRGYLKSHVRMHTGEKPFNCQVCGKSFTQKSNLNIHLKGHTGGKPHSCKFCGECFAYKMMLNSHLKSHM